MKPYGLRLKIGRCNSQLRSHPQYKITASMDSEIIGVKSKKTERFSAKKKIRKEIENGLY